VFHFPQTLFSVCSGLNLIVIVVRMQLPIPGDPERGAEPTLTLLPFTDCIEGDYSREVNRKCRAPVIAECM
jgi:hypothetical protein